MSAQIFDLAPLLDAVGGDRDIVGQVITLFISGTDESLVAIKKAIASQDPKAVKMTAHHLKGSLLELGATEAVALALELEKMGINQQLQDADKVWQKLDKAIHELVLALNQTEFRQPA